MKENKNINSYLTVLLFFLICYRALYQYIQIDGDGRIVTAFGFLTIVYLGVFNNVLRKELQSFPIKCWTVLMTYQIGNAIIQGTYDSNYNQVFITIQEICILVIVAYMFNANKQRLFLTLIISLFVYLYIANVFCTTDDETGGRLSGFIYTTQLGQLSGLTCVIIALYIYYQRKPPIYITLFLFPCSILLLTQSRNGLLPLLFSLLILMYPQIIKVKVQNLFLYVLLTIAAIYYFQTTDFFERILGAKDSYESSGLFYTGTILDDIFEDRAIYYFLGYFNFLDNPIFGIGLMNFADYNNFEYGLHSEFLVHSVEGGLIGLILYISFIGYLLKYLFAHYSKSDIEQNCMILSLLPILMISFTARIYQYSFFFIIYGIIIGYIIKRKNTL